MYVMVNSAKCFSICEKKSSNAQKVQLKSACTSSLLMKVTAFMGFLALKYIFVSMCVRLKIDQIAHHKPQETQHFEIVIRVALLYQGQNTTDIFERFGSIKST